MLQTNYVREAISDYIDVSNKFCGVEAGDYSYAMSPALFKRRFLSRGDAHRTTGHV